MNKYLEQYIITSLEETAHVMQVIAVEKMPQLIQAANIIVGAISVGGKLLICGNGGSAADAQHVAAEFVGRFSKAVDRPPLPAIALTTDTSFLTAFCNDYCFEDIFARQIQAIGKEDDVLLGISTSGGSENILRAFRAAHLKDIRTIGLCGESGQFMGLAQTVIQVPSSDTAVIQNVHLALEHVLCGLVEKMLFPVLSSGNSNQTGVKRQ